MRSTPALAAAAALLAACVSLTPRPDPTRYYVLEADARPGEPARPPVAAVGVGPVRLPAYLDRPELVTRAGPARIDVASVDRWAAPLDALFASALAEDLRAAIPAREVLAWPWLPGAGPEWSVAIEVVRFEGDPDGSAVLDARWTLRRAGAVVGQGSTISREPRATPDLAGTVAALSRTVGALARDVAAAVEARRAAAGLPAP